MRKHIDYFYKSYDKIYRSELERREFECFNEYGYNFDSNNRREEDLEKRISRTNYNSCKNKIKDKRK